MSTNYDTLKSVADDRGQEDADGDGGHARHAHRLKRSHPSLSRLNELALPITNPRTNGVKNIRLSEVSISSNPMSFGWN